MTTHPIMPVDRDEVSALRARVKELESRVAELERRWGGAAGGNWPSGVYFENGRAVFGGQGGGGQG